MSTSPPTRRAAGGWLVPAIVYAVTVALSAAIVVANPTDWHDMLSGEGTPFVWLSCSLILTAAVLSLLASVVVGVGGAGRTFVQRAWGACGLGLLLADIDERFRLHERATILLGLTEGAPWMHHIHPLLIAYAVGGALFLLLIHREYRAVPGVRALLGAGVGCFAVSVVVEAFADMLPAPLIEETLELLAAASIVGACYVALMAEIDRLRRPAPADEGSTQQEA